MDDYISRQAAITEGCDAACGELKDTCTHPKDCDFWMGLMNLPAADVAPVVHGEWIHLKNKQGVTVALRCSACGNSPKFAIRSDFCPNCGAKMDGKREGEQNGYYRYAN